MAASSRAPFVSIVQYEGALKLIGDNARNPLTPGQTVIAHGLFTDGTETGAGAFVVLRASGKPHHYEFAPLGCVDRFWQKHLSTSPSVHVKLVTKEGEKVLKEVDQITRWQIVSEPGRPPTNADLTVLGKLGAEKALRTWSFLADYIIKDQQACNDPPSSGN